MSAVEIGILIGAIALVAFTAVFNIVRKMRGKSGCGCASSAPSKKGGCDSHCGCCPYSHGCASKNGRKAP